MKDVTDRIVNSIGVLLIKDEEIVVVVPLKLLPEDSNVGGAKQ